MLFNYRLGLLDGLVLTLSLCVLSSAQQSSDGNDFSESMAARDIFSRQTSDYSMTNTAEFQRQMLNGHDFYRAEHGAGPIRWNSQRADASTAWSRRCVFQHSGTRGAGENIAAGFNNVLGVVNGWGSERTKYNFGRQGFSQGTGHFTQMVWKGTTSVGCGRTYCPGMGWFTVCQYAPQGNIVSGNFFSQNVGRQTFGRSTDVWRGQSAGGFTRSVPFDSAPETTSTGTSDISSTSTGEDSTGGENEASSTSISTSLSNVVYTTPNTVEIPLGGVFTASRDDRDGDITLTAAAEPTNTTTTANKVGSRTNRHNVSIWSILFGVVIGAAGVRLIRALH